MHSPRFEELREKYKMRFVTAEQLHKYVHLQVITQQEYDEIVIS